MIHDRDGHGLLLLQLCNSPHHAQSTEERVTSVHFLIVDGI